MSLRWMGFSGWVATLAGWYVTEIGRQPYIVFGQLLTRDVVATVPAEHVAWTLIGYLVMYVLLLTAYVMVLRYMSEKPLLSPAQANHAHLSSPAALGTHQPQGAQR